MNFINNWLRPIQLAASSAACTLDLPDGTYQLTCSDSQTAATRWEVVGAEVSDGTVTLTRGLEGTAAQDWPEGSVIYCGLTAGLLTQLMARPQPRQRLYLVLRLIECPDGGVYPKITGVTMYDEIYGEPLARLDLMRSVDEGLRRTGQILSNSVEPYVRDWPEDLVEPSAIAIGVGPITLIDTGYFIDSRWRYAEIELSGFARNWGHVGVNTAPTFEGAAYRPFEASVSAAFWIELPPAWYASDW